MATIRSLEIEIKANAKGAKAQMLQLQKQIDDLSKVTNKMRGHMRKAGLSVDKTGNLMKKGAKSSKTFGDSISASSRNVGGLLVSMTPLSAGIIGITAAMSAMTKKSVLTATRFADLRVSLIAATGSMEAANKMFDDGAELANRYGLEIETTIKSMALFQASTKNTSLEGQKSMEIFESASKAARAFGLSQEDLGGVLKAFSQIASKGTVQMEELKGQLGDRLPSALNIAADAMGMTKVELFKMIEQGKLASEEFLPKFTEELNKTTEASIAFAQSSPSVAFARLDNALKLLSESAGVAILPTVVNLVETLTASLHEFNAWRGEFDQIPFDKLELAVNSSKAEVTLLQMELDNYENKLSKLNPDVTAFHKLKKQIHDTKKEIEEATDTYGEMWDNFADRARAKSNSVADGHLKVVRTASLVDNAFLDSSKTIGVYKSATQKAKEEEISLHKELVASAKATIAKNEANLTLIKSELELMMLSPERRALLEKSHKEIAQAISDQHHIIATLNEASNKKLHEIDDRGNKQRLTERKQHLKEELEALIDHTQQKSEVEKALGSQQFKESFTFDPEQKIEGDSPLEVEDQYATQLSQMESFFAQQQTMLEQNRSTTKAGEEAFQMAMAELTQSQYDAELEAFYEKELRKDEIRKEWQQNELQTIGFSADVSKRLTTLDEQTATQKTQTAIKSGREVLSALGSNSKKMFKIQKALALADAVISMQQGISKGVALGWPLAIPAIAFAVANGVASIQKIKATQFGGGASGGASVAGGSIGSTDSATGSTTGLADNTVADIAPTQVQEVSVFANGKIFDRESIVEIIDGINEAVGDNVELRVA